MSDLSGIPLHSASDPFHSLNNDILLHIFTLNGDMFLDTYALHTTRISSQVCRQWRDLMLNAPFLWARLIDLDRIYNAWNREWRNELLLRSGAAPLWIRAEFNPYVKISQVASPTDRYDNIEHFLLKVLSGNWHRIQKLIINSECWSFPRNLDILCSPAPQLEEIEIKVEEPTIHPYDLRLYDIEFPVFANFAPFLRRLTLRNHVVNHRAPWLNQLYFLNIDAMHNVRDALQVLSAAHNLRELRIISLSTSLGRKETCTPLTNVSLPHLKLLEYYGGVEEGAELLDQIETPLDCSLAIRAWFSLDEEAAAFFALVNVFARQIQGHVRSRKIDSICVKYLPNSITIELETTFPVKYYFHLHILRLPDTPVYDTIMNSIAFPEFSCATIIRFVAVGPLHPCFGSFLNFLTSVHTIFTESGTLQLIMDLQGNMISTNNPRILLPTLSIIDLHTVDPVLDDFSVDAPTAAFILSRLRDGHPIATLNLTVEDMAPFNAPPNLDALAEVDGLKVTYKLSQARGIFEYICGSGDPARLIDTV
ncbi:hypothetical protein HYPSUDRAFT_206538 [Hypholoma sublateritium FD-334 SS-4]|uniref:Uncharacterized protein n=1 Tax=Hypholoma sublateritium (strain FD-334 SS-4) TaxID=945553 RepID=A0A0D2P9D1_HYPSF|nr:hypothetical protein HYPSUDRAFT_206538 [Hypholoma sublateritium FD-334 SS-4]